MIEMIAAASLLATTQVYRLERDTESERLCVVGQDGVRRECCIVDPTEYAILTGRVDQVWRSMNATHDGRIRLHGKLVRQEVADDAKTDVYADGYRFTAKMQPKRTMRPAFTNAVRKASSTVIDRSISERQRAWRERVRASKTGIVREVTVEHDAATGKDIVK